MRGRWTAPGIPQRVPASRSHSQKRERVAVPVGCPYHAWSYDLDGSLERAAQVEDLAGFDRAKAALHPIRMEVFHGLLPGHTDNHAKSLVEQVPDLDEEMTQYAPRLAQLNT